VPDLPWEWSYRMHHELTEEPQSVRCSSPLVAVKLKAPLTLRTATPRLRAGSTEIHRRSQPPSSRESAHSIVTSAHGAASSASRFGGARAF
jgi:hypothetical protein